MIKKRYYASKKESIIILTIITLCTLASVSGATYILEGRRDINFTTYTNDTYITNYGNDTLWIINNSITGSPLQQSNITKPIIIGEQFSNVGTIPFLYGETNTTTTVLSLLSKRGITPFKMVAGTGDGGGAVYPTLGTALSLDAYYNGTLTGALAMKVSKHYGGTAMQINCDSTEAGDWKTCDLIDVRQSGINGTGMRITQLGTGGDRTGIDIRMTSSDYGYAIRIGEQPSSGSGKGIIMQGGNLTIYNGARLGVGTITPAGQAEVVSFTATTIPLIVKGAASQSSNLQEWQDSSNTPLSVISATGKLGVGTSTPIAIIEAKGTANSNGHNIEINSTSAYGGFGVLESGSLRAEFAFGNDGNIFNNALLDSLAIRSEYAMHLGANMSNGAAVNYEPGMTINGRNVGIRTVNPRSILDVNGTISTNMTGSGNDYVCVDANGVLFRSDVACI